jgi:hypothetical protein
MTLPDFVPRYSFFPSFYDKALGLPSSGKPWRSAPPTLSSRLGALSEVVLHLKRSLFDPRDRDREAASIVAARALTEEVDSERKLARGAAEHAMAFYMVGFVVRAGHALDAMKEL